MKFSTYISIDGLYKYLNDPDWVIVDCRFWLDEPGRGRIDYNTAHIPEAYYAHLDEDLSGPIILGKTGRHPLPDVDILSKKLGSWGIGSRTQVIAYDDRGGMIAARLWWLLRWLGHENVALLDGGFPAWVAAGYPVNNEIPTLVSSNYIPNVKSEMVFSAEDVLFHFGDSGYILIDSREPERYRGQEEPIDPVAGHIPGAINYPFIRNIDSNGQIQLKQVLKGRFESIFGNVPAENVTFYCGSGVTAALNVLAVAHAGLGTPRIYAGSWSEWITDPDRPIALGE